MKMKSVKRLVIIIMILLFASGSAVFGEDRVWRDSGTALSDDLTILDDTMKKFMTEKKISAGALAVTYKSRLMLAKGYSWSAEDAQPITPDSLFRIASISKPITATAVLHMVEEGKLRLDEKVVDVLDMTPQEGKKIDPRLKEVTILHLLQHLGGWNMDTTFCPMFQDKRIAKKLKVDLPITQANIITYMTGRKLQHDPGSKYVYSNYGYCLLGRVIEKRSGMDYEKYVQSQILHPLGITQMRLGRNLPEHRAPGEVRYEPSWVSYFTNIPSGSDPYGLNIENMDSHGGWIASAAELVRFASAFDEPSKCPILSAATIEQMFALPQNISPSDYHPGDPYYACGWLVRDFGKDQRTTFHGGQLPGTFATMARLKEGINLVILFNKIGEEFLSSAGPSIGKAVATIEEWPEGDLF